LDPDRRKSELDRIAANEWKTFDEESKQIWKQAAIATHSTSNTNQIDNNSNQSIATTTPSFIANSTPNPNSNSDRTKRYVQFFDRQLLDFDCSPLPFSDVPVSFQQSSYHDNWLKPCSIVDSVIDVDRDHDHNHDRSPSICKPRRHLTSEFYFSQPEPTQEQYAFNNTLLTNKQIQQQPSRFDMKAGNQYNFVCGHDILLL
jgi:hypothetical protein